MKKSVKILFILVGIIMYFQIGNMYAYYVKYANYYPNSLAGKILFPCPYINASLEEFQYSVFSAPDIDPKLQNDFDSFENYLKNYPKVKTTFLILFWPIGLLVAWIFFLVCWIFWLIMITCNGDILRFIGIIR